MIDPKTLDSEWLEEISAKHRKADKILIEKAIRALFLLEGLSGSNLHFVFKGGTALMLLNNASKRLSIDIDIIVPQEPAAIDKLLQSVASRQGFTRVEPQSRSSKANIPKLHYQFFYHPAYQTRPKEDYILLDVLFDEVNYQKVNQLPIVSPFIKQKGAHSLVNLPSPEDMLGDKLTAFAPNTTGIPYFKKGKSMNMEIIKQLYDIASLMDIAYNLSISSHTFRLHANRELYYRDKTQLQPDDVLEDILQTSLCIVSRGMAGTGDFYELKNGIQRASHYIHSESFHLDKAITLASKIAYVALALRNNHTRLEKYSNHPWDMKQWKIENPLWPKLNKLKKSKPEAFFYWYKAHELL